MNPDEREAFDDVLRAADEIAERLADALEAEGLLEEHDGPIALLEED